MQLALPTDDWEGEKAVAYPLYRIAGGILDFHKLLTLGLPGLYVLIEEKKKTSPADSEAEGVYAGMLLCLDTLKEVIGLYRERAGQRAQEILGRKDSEENRAAYRRMKAVEGAMASILTKKPAHLLEAVELFWMYVLVSEVLEEIKKDCPYYGTEGGVTLSGGEPLLQADFAAVLLKECKKAGISTCVETAGFVPWEAFEKVYGLTDLFLFDYKLDSQEEMDRYTGGKLETILDNLECLAALEKEIILRCPVIPGVNDTDGHFRAIARLAKKCRIRRAELMPYHSWGEPKWEHVGRPYGLSGLKTMTQQEADACRARLDDLMKTENGEE